MSTKNVLLIVTIPPTSHKCIHYIKNSLNEIRLIKKFHDFFKRISLQIDCYRETTATFSVAFINEVFKVNKTFFQKWRLQLRYLSLALFYQILKWEYPTLSIYLDILADAFFSLLFCLEFRDDSCNYSIFLLNS